MGRKKKKKDVVRCAVCGIKAVGIVYGLPVCKNLACHEAAKEQVRAALAEGRANV